METTAINTMTSSIVGALGDFSATNLIEILTSVLPVVVPLVLAWFAFRYIWRRAKGGIKRGA